jgi:mRNA interferase MazF
MLKMMIKRGDIFWINFAKQDGSHIICGKRPVIIVSNDTANRFSPVISVVPVTTGQKKKALPTHVQISGYGLSNPSTVLTEQLLSVEKSNLLNKIGTLSDTDDLRKIESCLCIQLGVA